MQSNTQGRKRWLCSDCTRNRECGLNAGALIARCEHDGITDRLHGITESLKNLKTDNNGSSA